MMPILARTPLPFPSSRVHRLADFGSDFARVFVKRDDELGCGINGTKWRKYYSLIPFLISEQIKHLVIIAGPQSNNLLAALQIARELGIAISVFLLKNKSPLIQGNYKLSRLFMDEESIHWVEREQWCSVEHMAKDYAKNQHEKTYVLYEGAAVPEAMIGAKTLALDILQNEADLGIQFDHILVDAGTGFSAAALIAGMNEHKHLGCIHVLLLADREETFYKKLNVWNGTNEGHFKTFYPKTARSFGAINQSIYREIERMAKEEGILCDPIYSAKLFQASRHYILEQNLTGTILIVHSGGVLSLSELI